ncbi:MAG: hypothetical protein AAGI38_17260 [Bacteroidota bacterium]
MNDSLIQARTLELEAKLVAIKKTLEKKWEATGNRDSARNAFREKIFQEFDEFFSGKFGLDFDSLAQAEGWAVHE